MQACTSVAFSIQGLDLFMLRDEILWPWHDLASIINGSGNGSWLFAYYSCMNSKLWCTVWCLAPVSIINLCRNAFALLHACMHACDGGVSVNVL